MPAQLAVAARRRRRRGAEAEVGEVDVLLAVGVGDQDVGRLDVAVHEAAGVGGVEGVGDAGHDPGGPARAGSLRALRRSGPGRLAPSTKRIAMKRRPSSSPAR